MNELIKNNPSQIGAAIVSFLIAVFAAWFIEDNIEGPISKTGLSNLTIPISVAFGLISNIVILLNFDLLKRIPGIEKVINTVDRQNNVTTKLFENLKTEQVELQKIYTHLHSKNLILKEFGDELIQDYLEGFNLDEHGLSLNGEHWSLRTYIQFWEFLANMQEQIKSDKNRKNIIARITHSNDVNIWSTDDKAYKRYAEDAYLFQKKFIENGGIVVRILFGEEDTPNKIYKDIMNKMESINIEVKYLPQRYISEKDFDFMYLADEEIVMKWYSGNKGKRLSRCSIVDNIDNTVKRTWANLFYILQQKRDPIKSIPKDREYQL